MNEEIENAIYKKVKESFGTITREIKEDPDSIEVGTPGKGGAIKVYGNFNNPDEFKKKIDNAIEVRKYAIEMIGI